MRHDRAEIWAGLKSPIVAQQDIAEALGLPQDRVTVNVVTGGGSFGRKLFFDAALEAAESRRRCGKPVKLMWHRADDARVRAAATRWAPRGSGRPYLAGQVLTFEQRHTSVETDFSHGLGEMHHRHGGRPAGRARQPRLRRRRSSR